MSTNPYEYDTVSPATAYQSNPPQPTRSNALIVASWAVIVLVVLGIGASVVWSQYMMPRGTQSSGAEMMTFNMTAKTLLGSNASDSTALTQIAMMKKGPIEQRLAHVILINEFAGPEKALLQLDEMDDAVRKASSDGNDGEPQGLILTQKQERLRTITRKTIACYQAEDYVAQQISDEERELLKTEFGFIGQLTFATKHSPDQSTRQELVGSAQRLTVIMFTGIGLGVVGFLSGCVCFCALSGLFFSKNLSAKFENHTDHGFVYVETFAFWLILFIGLQLVTGGISVLLLKPSLAIILSPLAFFGSLLALAWPVYRGIPMHIMCKDIGLEFRRPEREVVAGIASYLAMLLPISFGLVTAGVLASMLEKMSPAGEFESSMPAGHPIAEEISAGGPIMYFFIALSACVAAPIVEEIMFRGVLYRYLRDATGFISVRWISVALSALFGGLIFATIHPQGVVAIPALTILAMGFSLTREWRNSLIAPMLMHAIHNGILTSFLLVMLV